MEKLGTGTDLLDAGVKLTEYVARAAKVATKRSR